jgi:tetratricopeptide (TPR) repeat protein
LSELTRPGNDHPSARAQAIESARQAIARAEAAAREDRTDEALAGYAEAASLPLDDAAGLAVRADALRGAGIVHQSRAAWSEAERSFLLSRQVAIELDDDVRVGRAENCLGAVAFESGDWPAAERHYAEARHAAEAAGDLELLAQLENNVGTVLAARGERVKAEAAFRRAIERFEKLEKHPCVARVLTNLGLVLVQQGRLPQAATAYERALAECKRHGDAMFATKILINQSRMFLARKDGIQAHAAAMKAWAFARRLEDGPVAAGALCLLGEVALAFRDHVGAIYYLRRALNLAAREKAPLVEAETWVQIGNLYYEQGKLTRAIDTWRFARLCYRRLGADPEDARLEARIDSVEREARSRDPGVRASGTYAT